MLTEIYCRFTIIDYTTYSFLSLKSVYIVLADPVSCLLETGKQRSLISIINSSHEQQMSILCLIITTWNSYYSSHDKFEFVVQLYFALLLFMFYYSTLPSQGSYVVS